MGRFHLLGDSLVRLLRALANRLGVPLYSSISISAACKRPSLAAFLLRLGAALGRPPRAPYSRMPFMNSASPHALRRAAADRLPSSLAALEAPLSFVIKPDARI